MMNRLAVVIAGLSFGCGPGAGSGPDSGKTVASTSVSSTQTPETATSDSAPVAVSPADTAMTYAEAKKRSDELWRAAETQKTNVAAWQQAAAGLAATARLAEGGGADAKDVLRGALAAWRNAEQLAPKNSTDSTGDARGRRSLPEREVLRLAVLEQLAPLLDAGDKDRAMVEYRRGRILWSFGHYVEAVAPFAIVVERFPASQEAKYSASLMLDSLLLANDLAGLETQARAMLKNTVLIATHDELKSTLERIRHQAGVKGAQALADAGDFAACAQAYLALFKRDGKLPGLRPDHLLHNASVCFEKSDQIKRAIQTLRELARKFPTSGLAAKAKERADALAAQ